MRRVLGAAALAMLGAFAARAGDVPPPAAPLCHLGQAASFDAATTPEGMITVRGKVDGHEGAFLVDTGGMGGILGFAPAFAMHLSLEHARMGGQFPGGTTLEYGAIVRNFNAGPISYSNMFFLVAPDRMLQPDTIGSIQPHLWKGFDVEVDFVKGKLNLFLEKQCPGHVVYWTHEAVAAVPMSVDASGHIAVEAMLDGKPIEAVLDSGAEHSTMSMAAARAVFGIDDKSPALKSLGEVALNYVVPTKTYRYPFKALTFEGIAVQNPDIVIADTGADSEEPTLVVGIGALRQLHLFIAYDEKMLYLTAAEAY